jgi:hypothetical protein
MSAEWVAQPTVDDAKIRESTGRGWDEWAGLIDAGPGRDAGHTTIARWLVDEHGVDAWWAQGVTVGYERIRGLRLPGQMPDGTFSVSRSRTLDVPAADLRAILLDDERRSALLGGMTTVLASKPEAKSLRFHARSGEEEAGILSFAPVPTGERTKLTVTHEKLASPEEAERWKSHWGTWLQGFGPRPRHPAAGTSLPRD